MGASIEHEREGPFSLASHGDEDYVTGEVEVQWQIWAHLTNHIAGLIVDFDPIKRVLYVDHAACVVHGIEVENGLT